MLLGLGFFAMAALLPLAAQRVEERQFPVLERPAGDPLQRFGPAGLLAFTFLSLFSSTKYRGVYFSPAEVDFLFPAPFTRRELLSYRLATQFIHILLSVFFTGALICRYLPGFWQTVAGLFLTFAFINLVQIAGSLLAGTLEERVLSRGRRFVGIFLVTAVLLVFAASSAVLTGGEDFRDSVRDFLGSRALGWVLLPLKAFSEMLAARDLKGFLVWSGGALAVDLALLALVLRLDVDYTEASLETSRKLHHRLQQFKRGGRPVSAAGKLRVSIPLPGRWAGAGPLVWRQAQEMVRETPGVVYLLLLFLAALTLPIAFISRSDEVPAAHLADTVLGLVAFSPFILSNWFRFDFRGDLDRMELLLTLPLSPTLIAMGQLAVPALALSAVQLGGIAVLAGLGGGSEEGPGSFMMVYGPALCLPFNVLFIAIENLFFLLFPQRMGSTAPGDFQTVGRLMATLAVKMLVLASVALIGGCLAYLAFEFTGGSAAAVLATLAGFLIVADLGAVALVGQAFRRFDVTRRPAD